MKITPRIRKMVSDKISILDVLKQLYGIDASHGQKISCPFPDHGGPDKDPSAVVSEEKNLVHCFKEGRDYGVVEAMLVAGIAENKIIGLVIDNSVPQRTSVKGKRRGLPECRKIFQEQAQGTVQRMRRGQLTWRECWPAIDSYFQKVNEGD